MTTNAMLRKTLAVLVGFMALVASVGPSRSDGWPQVPHEPSYRVLRHSSYGVGLISRNVITPYYYGYYGSHYSYVAPDPIYVRSFYRPATCWYWSAGRYFRIC